MTPASEHKARFLSRLDITSILANPILDIAARFWDDDRYRAFRTCYKSMRWLDDLVDNHKSSSDRESPEITAAIDRRIDAWTTALLSNRPIDDIQKHLLETMHRFAIPAWPWERLAKSMLYDLHHDGFPSLLGFLRYCEGAAISPASVFMHLCGVTKSGNKYIPPAFDIRAAARPLALFAYFVHIIRDFQKDIKDGLCYFPDSLLKRYALKMSDLKQIASGGPVAHTFRNLVGVYESIAGYFHGRVEKMSRKIYPHLSPEYQFSLEVIFQLYSQIFEKIDHKSGSLTSAELVPTPEEITHRIARTAHEFALVMQ